MEKKWWLTGVILIFLSIILGAFGAHALKEVLNDEQLASFETGVRYQIYHGLAFLVLPFVFSRIGQTGKGVYALLLCGVILFSGSIYGLTWCNIEHLNGLKKGFGPITPLGGLLMIVGWAWCFFQLLRWRND